MQDSARHVVLTLAFLSLAFSACATSQEEAHFAFGGTKQSAVDTLRQLGIQTLALDVHPRVAVTSLQDFEDLKEAEGVIIGTGDLRAGFRGNSLDYLQIAPIYDRWRSYFDGANSRTDVLAGLERLFAAEPGVAIRSVAIRNTHVSIKELPGQDSALLDHYDEWSGSYTNPRGYWHLTLSFEQGRLTAVNRQWSPGPL